jgi:hypothetical protein
MVIRGSSNLSSKLFSSVNRWKVFAIILFGIAPVLATGLFFYYDRYGRLNVEYATLSSQYAKLNADYSQLSVEKARIEEWYSSMRRQVNFRQGIGEDQKGFITPDDPRVRSLTTQITGGWENPADANEYWSDLGGMYNWVLKSISFSYDSPTAVLPEIGGSLSWREDFYRFPNETIGDKTGDCEDQALLLASMILNYGNKGFSVWAIGLSVGASGHIAVAFPVVGGGLTILDPAGRFHTQNWEGNLGSKDVHSAVTEWIQYWSSMGGQQASVVEIFSETEYRAFSNTDDFVNWVLSSAHQDTAPPGIPTGLEILNIGNVYATRSGSYFYIYLPVENFGTTDVAITSITMNGMRYSDWAGATVNASLPLNIRGATTQIILLTIPYGAALAEERIVSGAIISITVHTAGGREISTGIPLP